jgi:hypothetical protein
MLDKKNSTNKTQAWNGDQYVKKDVAKALRATLNLKDPGKTKYQIFGLSKLQQHTRK